MVAFTLTSNFYEALTSNFKKVFGLGSYFHESYVNEFNRIQLYLDR